MTIEQRYIARASEIALGFSDLYCKIFFGMPKSVARENLRSFGLKEPEIQNIEQREMGYQKAKGEK